MAEFLFLMHGDHESDQPLDWDNYLQTLSSKGVLRGGSAIGPGLCLRRETQAPAITDHLVGYIKVEVDDLDQAKALVKGNPVYEASGTVEVRELPVTD